MKTFTAACITAFLAASLSREPARGSMHLIQPNIVEYHTSISDTTGKIPVLMYHVINCSAGRLSVCPDSLHDQLHYMHERGFRAVTLDEYTNNNFTRLVSGERPYLLTFDDSEQSQFILRNGVPSSQSAVAIIERFRVDYHVRVPATFFAITSKPLFGERQTELDKLEYLVAHDFSIGNHTDKHENLTRASTARATAAFKTADETLTYLLGSNWGSTHTAAYPYGGLPQRPQRDSLAVALHYLVLFHAYGGLAKTVPTYSFDPTAINRYETNSTGARPAGIQWFLNHFMTAVTQE